LQIPLLLPYLVHKSALVSIASLEFDIVKQSSATFITRALSIRFTRQPLIPSSSATSMQGVDGVWLAPPLHTALPRLMNGEPITSLFHDLQG
jgi:hypothetical protein